MRMFLCSKYTVFSTVFQCFKCNLSIALPTLLTRKAEYHGFTRGYLVRLAWICPVGGVQSTVQPLDKQQGCPSWGGIRKINWIC